VRRAAVALADQALTIDGRRAGKGQRSKHVAAAKKIAQIKTKTAKHVRLQPATLTFCTNTSHALEQTRNK
jgi:hypothetical protein